MGKKKNLKVKSLFFFDNGNVAAFDEYEHQIPEIQSQNWLKLYFAFLSKIFNIDVEDIKEIYNPRGEIIEVQSIKEEVKDVPKI